MNLFSAILKLSFVVGCLVVHGGADKTDYCPEFPCGWFPYSPSDPEVKRDVGILMNKYNDVNDRKLSASVEKIRAALMTYSKNYRRYDVFISSQECMVDKCVPLYWTSRLCSFQLFYSDGVPTSMTYVCSQDISLSVEAKFNVEIKS